MAISLLLKLVKQRMELNFHNDLLLRRGLIIKLKTRGLLELRVLNKYRYVKKTVFFE